VVGVAHLFASLPQMHLLAYEMPETLKEAALNSLSEFSLTELFRTKKDGDQLVFIHESEVQKWLELLRGQELSDRLVAVLANNPLPMPFVELNLLTTLRHIVWYLPSADACIAMRDLLRRSHNKFFKDYEIVVVAGNEVGMGQEALEPVEQVITNVPQDATSITLSCGKLMTGVTHPAWAGIFMLRELKSPEAYFWAVTCFQSPWAYE
jgi:hypothetical protein